MASLITLSLFSGVEKLAFVLIEIANVWNDDTVIRNVDIFKLKGFAIVGGEDANKFTLNGSELTFKAPEFQDGSDNTYRVNIKATWKNPWFQSHWV
jgi:hypothetical protein